VAASLQFCATQLNRYGKPQRVLPESVDEPERELANPQYWFFGAAAHLSTPSLWQRATPAASPARISVSHL